MGESTYRAPGVSGYLADEKVELEELEYASKALTAPGKVRRWSVFRE